MKKLRTNLSVFSGATGETSSGLTGETRAIITPEKSSQKEKKEKISSYVSTNKGSNFKPGNKNVWLQNDQCLPPHVPPFNPGIKSLRNEENDDNLETTDT